MTGKSKNQIMRGLAKKINALAYNFGAEIVVSDLINNGIDRKEIEIEFESSHRRNWDKDISKAEVREGKIFLKLTRDGFIHSLPDHRNLIFEILCS
jgi:hypothetical protein